MHVCQKWDYQKNAVFHARSRYSPCTKHILMLFLSCWVGQGVEIKILKENQSKSRKCLKWVQAELQVKVFPVHSGTLQPFI